MAERVNELTELHPDKQLALRIENGEVTKEEVHRVWEETRDLSAQTDFDTRRAVVALRKCGSLNDAWPVFFTQLTEMMSQMRGAMVNENSKFAHLVAGTEAIVKTMQNLNPLQQRLDDMARMMLDFGRKIDSLGTTLEVFTKGSIQLEPLVEEKPREDGVRRVESEPMDFEKDDEQARKETIGSAWAK